MENKVKIWVYKDVMGILRPHGFIAPREGRIADYVQPDIDKYLGRKGIKGKVVKAEVIEVTE